MIHIFMEYELIEVTKVQADRRGQYSLLTINQLHKFSDPQ